MSEKQPTLKQRIKSLESAYWRLREIYYDDDCGNYSREIINLCCKEIDAEVDRMKADNQRNEKQRQ